MNDLDPLISEAMARVKHPSDPRPSITDVHRRARRSNRRRMTATVGAVACTGVATAALLIRRDSDNTRVATSADTDGVDGAFASYPPVTTFPLGPQPTTTMVPPQPVQQTIDPSFLWNSLSLLQDDPSATGLVYPPTESIDVDAMPTAEMFGCTTDECGAMFNVIVWHEIAACLGFFDVTQMQGMNPGIDFSQLPRSGDVLQSVVSSFIGPAITNPNDETPTTLSLFDGIVLIDGGAPVGAMEDAYQRLNGYNRTIVPATGKAAEQTMVMPIAESSFAEEVGSVFGVDGFDTWDPSFVAAPIEGLVAVVIGPDYFSLVQNLPGPNTAIDTTTSTTPIDTTTTSLV